MQSSNLRRACAVLAACFALGACSRPVNPYSELKSAPLVSAQLHTVTIVSADAAFKDAVQKAGYAPLTFSSNYPASDEVQGILWNVPDLVAAKGAEFKAPGAGPDVRVLVMALPPAAPAADSATEQDFFRNVLGADVPAWPANLPRSAAARVQVWTYFVPSILDFSKRLRENAIVTVTEPVAITTAYLGDHKTMSLRAPDGTVVQLVENAAQ